MNTEDSSNWLQGTAERYINARNQVARAKRVAEIAEEIANGNITGAAETTANYAANIVGGKLGHMAGNAVGGPIGSAIGVAVGGTAGNIAIDFANGNITGAAETTANAVGGRLGHMAGTAVGGPIGSAIGGAVGGTAGTTAALAWDSYWKSEKLIGDRGRIDQAAASGNLDATQAAVLERSIAIATHDYNSTAKLVAGVAAGAVDGIASIATLGFWNPNTRGFIDRKIDAATKRYEQHLRAHPDHALGDATLVETTRNIPMASLSTIAFGVKVFGRSPLFWSNNPSNDELQARARLEINLAAEKAPHPIESTTTAPPATLNQTASIDHRMKLSLEQYRDPNYNLSNAYEDLQPKASPTPVVVAENSRREGRG